MRRRRGDKRIGGSPWSRKGKRIAVENDPTDRLIDKRIDGLAVSDDRLAAGMTFICECGNEDPAYGETYQRRLCQGCLKKYIAGLESRCEQLEREAAAIEDESRRLVMCADMAYERAAKVADDRPTDEHGAATQAAMAAAIRSLINDRSATEGAKA